MADVGFEENIQHETELDNDNEKTELQFDLLEELEHGSSTSTTSDDRKIKQPKKAKPQAKIGRIDDVLQELEKKAAEQLYGTANEAIEYMRSKWNLNISRVKSSEDMSYRTLEKSIHERPKNYWIQNRGRQKFTERSGFLANITKPYLHLGPPELDVPLLLMRNLPDCVVVDTSEWILKQIKREEERQRKEEDLPKLPRRKTLRPTYNKGHVKKGAGGFDVIDKLVKEGEIFQREMRGTKTFANILERWVEDRENEHANRGSPFGSLKVNKTVRKFTSSEAKLYEKYRLGYDASQRKQHGESILDDKTYHAEMIILERMLLAILDLIKSMLNVTKEQLDSQYRIPETVVHHLRSTSPEVKKRHTKIALPDEALAKLKNDRSMYSVMKTLSKQNLAKAEQKQSINYNKSFGRLVKASKQRMLAIQQDNIIGKPDKLYHTINRELPDILPLEQARIAEIYPNTINPDKLTGLSSEINKIIGSATYMEEHVPEIFSAKMEETPLEMSRRMERNKHRFELIFEKVTKSVRPVWHDIDDFQEMLLDEPMPSKSREKSKDRHRRISSLVTRTTSKGRHKKTIHLPLTPRIPLEDSIVTPSLPGSEEPIKLDSLEHSRINLLSKMPDAMFQIDQNKDYERLLKVSGVKNSDYSNFQLIMGMKRPFHETERKLSRKVAREIEQFEQNTQARFYSKVHVDSDDPVFESSIAKVRKAAAHLQRHEANKKIDEEEQRGKIPEKWFRELIDKCESLDAFRHHGCASAVAKMYKYCDLKTNSRPKLLNRFALVVVSLPVSELGTARFQHAIRFLLDHLFLTPLEMMKHWLAYRGIPYLF